jgi:hypothetical protein
VNWWGAAIAVIGGGVLIYAALLALCARDFGIQKARSGGNSEEGLGCVLPINRDVV